MQFAGDIVLCSTRRGHVERKLEEILNGEEGGLNMGRKKTEILGLKISRKKTEYLGVQ